MPNANRYNSLLSIWHFLILDFCRFILNVVVSARR
jgi:hypothetical protein